MITAVRMSTFLNLQRINPSAARLILVILVSSIESQIKVMKDFSTSSEYIWIHSDEGLTFETSAFESLYGG